MTQGRRDVERPEDEHPGRKHLRRLDRVHLEGPIFYLTCCVQHRARVLASDAVAAILVSAWTTPPETYGWLVGRYVVMPDHVHFFAATCRDDAKDLSRFVGGWKRWTAGLIRQQVDRGFGWQREFFDHLLRSSESYGAKWEYVRQNPVRAGLVPTPDAWPYQGEIFPLAW